MNRAEMRWVLLASLAVVLFASLPTLYAWGLADADHVFSGFVYNTEDGNSYIAKMRMGARGEWLFHLPFTTEPHPGAWLFTFHLLLGKLAAGLSLSFQLTYHLARVILGVGLLLTIYAFVAHFVADVATRRLAWALVAIGSGLGWLLTALGATHWLGDLPLDFWVPEAYVFLVVYSLPHLALAEALLLWAILWSWRAMNGDGLGWCFFAGLAAFVMTWIVPFYAGVLATALSAYLLALLIRRRRIPWREIGLVMVTGFFAVPPVLYNAWVFTSNAAFGTWAAQNRILSPHPLHYLLGYAPLLVPAIWGVVAAIRQRDGRWLLPVAWLVAVPFLVYMPFNLQRRMIASVQVPLALLAAVGFWQWFGKKRWTAAVYVALASLSNLLLVAGSLQPISQRTAPIYRASGEVAALKWLAVHAEPSETVLASFEVGNVIPAWTDLRVFAGHGPETLYSPEKQAAIQRFSEAQTEDAWRQSLLNDSGLDYVFYGPQERALGSWRPQEAWYLRPVYDKEGYVIYRVLTEASRP
jgi:hypothetical protein